MSDTSNILNIDIESLQEDMSIDVDNLPEDYYPKEDIDNSVIGKLWNLWKMYVDFYVVGNKELKKVMFHTFLGIILTDKGWNYIISGDSKCSTRQHLFIIQQSGTGKSQIMKALNSLLVYLEIPSRYTLQDNDAFLIGTTDQTKGGAMKDAVLVPGALSKLLSLCWDEGEVLFNKNVAHFNVDVMTAQFQSMMDEPGEIKGKGMRAGSIGYPSNTTLIAGSYMFDQFKITMLQKGFLQRMYLYFKVFTPAEIKEINVGIELMKLQFNPKKIQTIRKNLRQMVDDIPESTYCLHFDRDSVMKWIPEKLKIRADYIGNAYTGERQGILETFFNRFHVTTDKLACQHAILAGKKVIDYEDICYGRDNSIGHLKSVLKCFDGMSVKQGLSPEATRINVIKGIVKKHSGLTQSQLVVELSMLKERGKWDFGVNRTRELIKKMGKPRGTLTLKSGLNGAIHLHIRERFEL